uniref:Uncharacterized protein n=1 Tax=Anguilla anguilla TaxID=7936 RepID=A0A0E9TDQ1_ANGAN
MAAQMCAARFSDVPFLTGRKCGFRVICSLLWVMVLCKLTTGKIHMI